MSTPVWKGILALGPTSFPVKLLTGARAAPIEFHQIHQPCGSRVKQVLYCSSEDKPIPRAEIAKGFEYEKGRHLVFAEDELKASAAPGVMEVDQLVRPDQVDPIYFESSYYVVPGDGAESEYATVLNALKKFTLWAHSRLAISNRDRAVLIRPGRTGLIAHCLFFEHELRRLDEFRTDRSRAESSATLFSYLRKHAKPFEPSRTPDLNRERTLKLIEDRTAATS